MAKILFGPDGVGKTTVIQQWQRAYGSQKLDVLHGTNLLSWFGTHGEFLRDHGLRQADIPPEADFPARAAMVNKALLAFVSCERQVIIDGHNLHKTVIGVAAGMVEIPGAPRGTPVEELVSGPLQPYFSSIIHPDIAHTHVVLPNGVAGDAAGIELQRRLAARGDRSIWDPASAAESSAQAQASYALEDVLRRQGALVVRATLPAW